MDSEKNHEIAKRLRKIGSEMIDLGADMDYYGGFGEMSERGREMVGAGHMAISWADTIEVELV